MQSGAELTLLPRLPGTRLLASRTTRRSASTWRRASGPAPSTCSTMRCARSPPSESRPSGSVDTTASSTTSRISPYRNEPTGRRSSTGFAVVQSRHGAEFTMATLVVIGSQITGTPLRARAVGFRHGAPGSVAEHLPVFGVAPSFSQSTNSLVLDRAALDRPCPNADPALSRLNERRQPAYPSSPCWVVSSPSRSSEAVTRKPTSLSTSTRMPNVTPAA